MLIFIFVVIGLILVGLAAYAWVAWKDMRAQKDDDELHFDPWED